MGIEAQLNSMKGASARGPPKCSGEPLHDPLDQHQAQVVELGLNAATQAEALHLAAAQDLRVLSIRAVHRPWEHKRSGFSLLLFSQELGTLLDAGLALIDALESLTEKASTEDTGRLLGQLVRLLYAGKSFSEALEGFPTVFPPVYVALVRSSEETGSVSDALARYVGYRQRLDELRQKIIGAAVYPMVLLCVGGGVMLFLLGYVVPRFSLVFEGLDTELPWLSRQLMNTRLMLHEHQLALATTLCACIALGLVAAGQPGVGAHAARRGAGRQPRTDDRAYSGSS